jgi:hypothetical protein
MTATALAIGLVLVVVTALPASASAITSFTPVCGVVGTTVTLTGTGFTNMTGVTFGAGGPSATQAAVFQFVNDTTATAQVPPGASTGRVRVEVPAVNDTASAADFIVAPAAAATITSFAPMSGAVGATVVITGTNFCGTTGVTFNATAATTFTVDSETQITATVPTGATTGPLHVTTPNGTVDSATNFTVTGTATIMSFAPTSGPVGTSVVITGTNLTGATSVMFNTTAATSYVVDSATQITATVPTGATTGPLHVTTPSGTVDSATNFSVTGTVTGTGTGTGTATITSFAPTSGPVGTSVVITGTNLTGATSVMFNNASATTFTVNSATMITATVPTSATTGKITVTTPGAGGIATSATDFTVTTGPPVTKHSRSVNLNLKKHLIASGIVSVRDGYDACRSNVTVKIQRQKNGVWKTVGTDQTKGNGAYRQVLNDRTGKYRAIAKKEVLNDGVDICKVDRSVPANHRH